MNSTDSVRIRRTGIQGGCHRRRKQQRSPEDIGKTLGNNVYQSTEQFKADSLTLLVNPAADGMATGVMYEDDKDDFEYRKGQFAEYSFTASTDSKGNITVTMSQTGGKADYGQKTIRIAYVYDGKIAYSQWKKGNSVTMKTPKEKEFSLDPAKLDFSRTGSKK